MHSPQNEILTADEAKALVHPHHHAPEYGSIYERMLTRYLFLLRVQGLSPRHISSKFGDLAPARVSSASTGTLLKFCPSTICLQPPLQKADDARAEWVQYRTARIQYELLRDTPVSQISSLTGWSSKTIKRAGNAPTPETKYFVRVMRAMGVPVSRIANWFGWSTGDAPAAIQKHAPDDPFWGDLDLVDCGTKESVRDYLIRHAMRVGEPLSDLVERFDVSNTRIYQIARASVYRALPSGHVVLDDELDARRMRLLRDKTEETPVLDPDPITEAEIPAAAAIKHVADESLLDMLPEASVSRQTSDAVIKPISGDDLRGVLLACADQIKMAARDGEYSTTVAYRHLDDKRVQQASRSEHGIAVLLEPAIRMLEARGYTVDVTLRMDTRVQLLISVGWQ
jgi:hypothetical protein